MAEKEKPLTVSAKEAATIVGLGKTAFWERCKKQYKDLGLKPVPGSSPHRPRYLRADIERVASGMQIEPEGIKADVPSWANGDGVATGPRLRKGAVEATEAFGRAIVEALIDARVLRADDKAR